MRIRGSKILVTGASGFLGRHVVDALLEEQAKVIQVSRRTGCDLRDIKQTESVFHAADPEVVVHLAARVGGIGANMQHPASFFTDNMEMGMNVVRVTHQVGARLIFVSTVCAYPKFCPIPFKEEDLWNGYPEETNAPYGIAKRALLVMCQAYRKEYGFRFGCLIPANLFGPGDHFDEKTSHVIPALIRRFHEAKLLKKDSVSCWGTGKATRSFLYVTDAAKAIVRACEVLDDDIPVNLPGTSEIKMSDLAKMIAELVGYYGNIEWDLLKPDGQPRRFVDGSRAKNILGWEPRTDILHGLKETVSWYLRNVDGRPSAEAPGFSRGGAIHAL